MTGEVIKLYDIQTSNATGRNKNNIINVDATHAEVVLDNKTGLLFEPKNETDLVKKIELVYHNENLRIEITKNGLKNAEKYSLNNYLINLEEIYRELVK